ncbi:Fic family protein [Parabacteroides sp. PF5-6]|uniref:Fic family protein n=1 Tax=Parabacteroides sp. PF5-6 TaxID=1742403 RepID=UPI0024053AE3|nr:Fic family protein [Parabacteroides sp. PF5-6]MDF9830226.1 Fic family protein [Parabacteroides sp. PF5-6]
MKVIALISRFKELGIDKQVDYDKFYLYSLITHSTAIEGSTVTELENQLLFDEGLSAKGRSITEQLMNLDLKAAYEQSLIYAKKHTAITIDSLKHLSSIVMKNTGATYHTALGSFSSADGDLRLLNVTAGVGGRSYMNFTKVPVKLAEFCEQLNLQRQAFASLDIVQRYTVSFDAHYHLVTIHPWADGNGRMSRLLMNQLQFELGLIPSRVDKDRKLAYIESLISTRESGDIEIFRDFMFDEHARNLERMIQEYQKSMDEESVQGGDVPVNVLVNVPVNISERQRRMLHLMKEHKTITIQRLSEELDVNERTIRRDITFLRQRNLLVRLGADKNGMWEVRL